VLSADIFSNLAVAKNNQISEADEYTDKAACYAEQDRPHIGVTVVSSIAGDGFKVAGQPWVKDTKEREQSSDVSPSVVTDNVGQRGNSDEWQRKIAPAEKPKIRLT
jgi:hypothetical protein